MDRDTLLALLALLATVALAVLAPLYGAESRDGFRRPDRPLARAW